jgi:hypothetical protein
MDGGGVSGRATTGTCDILIIGDDMKRISLFLLTVLAVAVTGTTSAASVPAAPHFVGAATCVNGASGAAPAATLSWTAPTTNTDGSPIATPLTYTLYQGTTSGGEVSVATGITATTDTINTGLADSATYYFEVVVVDAHGNQSAKSNEVCKVFPAGVPNSVTITIT